MGPQPPHILVTDFVAHELLLPHCTAIISQGGPATILAAIDHGLPHLVLPQGADQFMNAPVLEASGAGLALMPPAATAERIRAAISRLLDEAAFADAARRMQAELAAMPGADTVLAEQLLDARPSADVSDQVSGSNCSPNSPNIGAHGPACTVTSVNPSSLR